MSNYLVRCLDCPKSEEHPWLPLTYEASCPACAQTSVDAHILEHPLHRCEVLPGEPTRRKADR